MDTLQAQVYACKNPHTQSQYHHRKALQIEKDMDKLLSEFNEASDARDAAGATMDALRAKIGEKRNERIKTAAVIATLAEQYTSTPSPEQTMETGFTALKSQLQQAMADPMCPAEILEQGKCIQGEFKAFESLYGGFLEFLASSRARTRAAQVTAAASAAPPGAHAPVTPPGPKPTTVQPVNSGTRIDPFPPGFGDEGGLNSVSLKPTFGPADVFDGLPDATHGAPPPPEPAMSDATKRGPEDSAETLRANTSETPPAKRQAPAASGGTPSPVSAAAGDDQTKPNGAWTEQEILEGTRFTTTPAVVSIASSDGEEEL